MKGLTGREYKGGDDIASVAEREPSFHRDFIQIATGVHCRAVKHTGTKTNTRASRQLCNSTRNINTHIEKQNQLSKSLCPLKLKHS